MRGLRLYQRRPAADWRAGPVLISLCSGPRSLALAPIRMGLAAEPGGSWEACMDGWWFYRRRLAADWRAGPVLISLCSGPRSLALAPERMWLAEGWCGPVGGQHGRPAALSAAARGGLARRFRPHQLVLLSGLARARGGRLATKGATRCRGSVDCVSLPRNACAPFASRSRAPGARRARFEGDDSSESVRRTR